MDHIDTISSNGKDYIYMFQYFLIRNYKDNKKTQSLINNFALKNKSGYFDHYTEYNMIFYKESSITNPEHLKANPRDWDRYSLNNDRIYEYKWLDGKFLSRKKIKNGEIVEPRNEVIISDIPDSSNK